MEGGTEVEWLGLAHPQWVSRWKLNLRGRNRIHAKAPAVKVTMLNAIVSCKPMPQDSPYEQVRN